MSCQLFADGASRGNPGPAGAGAALFDAAGCELAARSLFLGQCTNNAAEYRALLLGLHTALELGCGRLDIRLDSELLVRQLQGRYKVRNEGLKPLFQEARGLLERFEAWSVTHVPREQNKRADQLANQGIDQGAAAPLRQGQTLCYNLPATDLDLSREEIVSFVREARER